LKHSNHPPNFSGFEPRHAASNQGLTSLQITDNVAEGNCLSGEVRGLRLPLMSTKNRRNSMKFALIKKLIPAAFCVVALGSAVPTTASAATSALRQVRRPTRATRSRARPAADYLAAADAVIGGITSEARAIHPALDPLIRELRTARQNLNLFKSNPDTRMVARLKGDVTHAIHALQSELSRDLVVTPINTVTTQE
jgi:hypothetical protein